MSPGPFLVETGQRAPWKERPPPQSPARRPAGPPKGKHLFPTFKSLLNKTPRGNMSWERNSNQQLAPDVNRSIISEWKRFPISPPTHRERVAFEAVTGRRPSPDVGVAERGDWGSRPRCGVSGGGHPGRPPPGLQSSLSLLPLTDAQRNAVPLPRRCSKPP